MMHGTRLLSPSWRMHAARMRPTVSSGLNMMASTCWLITIDLKIQAVYYHHNCLGSVDIVVNWPIWLGVEDPVHFLHLIKWYYRPLKFWLLYLIILIMLGGWRMAEVCWALLELPRGSISECCFSHCPVNLAVDAWDSFRPPSILQPIIIQRRSRHLILSSRASIRCHTLNMVCRPLLPARSGFAFHGHLPGYCPKFGEAQEASYLTELNLKICLFSWHTPFVSFVSFYPWLVPD